MPLAYTSVDSGRTWTLSSSFSLPGSQPEGLLNAVTCISNKCIAVGESFQGGFVNTLPLAYTSTDNGASWTMTSPLPLPSGQTEGILTTVTCTGNLCYAAGLSSQAGLTNQLPLVYLSNDGGINWVLSNPLVLPVGQTQGQLTGGAYGKGF